MGIGPRLAPGWPQASPGVVATWEAGKGTLSLASARPQPLSHRLWGKVDSKSPPLTFIHSFIQHLLPESCSVPGSRNPGVWEPCPGWKMRGGSLTEAVLMGISGGLDE